MVIYIAVLISLFTTLFSKPIDIIFDLLSAPTADEMKLKAGAANTPSKIAKTVERLRRTSVAAISNIAAAGGVLAQKLIAPGTLTVKLPDYTLAAHELAKASAAIIAGSTSARISRIDTLRKQSFRKAGNKDLDVDFDYSDDENDDLADVSLAEARPPTLIVRSKSVKESQESVTPDTKPVSSKAAVGVLGATLVSTTLNDKTID